MFRPCCCCVPRNASSSKFPLIGPLGLCGHLATWKLDWQASGVVEVLAEGVLFCWDLQAWSSKVSRMGSIPKRELFIDGKWVRPTQGHYLDVVNPATEAVIGRIGAATAEDVNRAVQSATIAARTGSWTRSTGAHRAVVLRCLAEKVACNWGARPAIVALVS